MDVESAERTLRKTNAVFMFLVGLALSHLTDHVPAIAKEFAFPHALTAAAIFLCLLLWSSLMAVGVYRFFKVQPGKPLHWAWWAAPSAILVIGLGLLSLKAPTPGGLESKPPGPQELATRIDDLAILAEEDLLFESPLGFRIHIPKGYRYLSSPSDPLAFLAISPDTTVRIQVLVIQTSAPLDAVFSDILSRLQSSEHGFSIRSISNPSEDPVGSASCQFELERNGLVQQGFLSLQKSGVVLYQYQQYAPPELGADGAIQLAKIEQSFEIGPNPAG